MKQYLLLIAAITMANAAMAQITPAKTFQNLHVPDNPYTSSTIAYTEQTIGSDVEFTILNDELEPGRTITMRNVVIPDGDYDVYNRIVKVLGRHTRNDEIHDEDYAFTQTLFNNDDKLEFIVATINSEYNITQIEVVSEDGTVLATIPNPFTKAPSSAFLSVFELGENKYLTWNYEEYKYNTGDPVVCYKITNTSNSLTLQKMPASFAYPNPVSRNQMFTIQLENPVMESGSYVQITDLTGKIVSRHKIENQQNEVTVPVQYLASGQYIYSVVSNEKVQERGKVVVK